MKKLSLLLSLTVFICLTVTAQTNYYYQSGNLDALTSWTLNSNGTGSNPTNFTSASQIFNITKTTTVNSYSSTSATWTVSGTGSYVLVGNGSTATTLGIPAGNSIAGTVSVQTQATLKVESNSLAPFIAGTFSATTTQACSLVYDGSGTQYLPAGSYSGGLTINGTSNTVILNGNITIGAGSSGSPSSATLNVSSGTTLNLSSSNATIKRSSTIPSGATVNFGATGTIQPYNGYYVGFGSGANVITSNTNGLDASMNYNNISTTTNSFSAGVNYTFNGATSTPFSTIVCGTTTTSSSGTGSTSFTVSNTSQIAAGQSICVGAGQTIYGTVSSVSGTTVYATMSSPVGSGAYVNFRNSNLSISPNGVTINANVTSNTNLNLSGNLTISSGCNFNDNGNTINLSGNITGSGTHQGAGKITLTGSSPSISIGILGNLEVAIGIGNTFSLTNPLTINGTLTLTSGFLLLGSNNLTLSASALNGGVVNSISGGNSGNYIVTNGNGVLKMQSVNSTSPTKNPTPTIFPIGTSTSSYNPLSFAGTTNVTDISVGVGSVFTNNPLLPNNVVNTQWSILSSTVSSAIITYQYNISNQGSSYSSGNVVLGTYSGGYTESSLGSVSGSNPFNVSTISSVSLSTSSTNLYGIGTPNSFFNTVPNAPTAITASAGNAQASVSFTAPTNNGGSAITGYTVTSNPSGLTATGTASPITVTGLTNGTAYTFTVTATNGAGVGAASAASTAVTPITVANAPTGVSASPNNCFAVISFTPPSNNGGSPITGYTVLSSPGGLTGNGTGSPIIISGLSNGTSYSFTVTAINGAGNSNPSAASANITPSGTSPAAGFISDTALFGALNLNYPGMDSVRIAVEAGNYTLAKTQYRLFRINHSPKWLPLGTPSGNGTAVDSSAYKISQNWIGPDQVGNCPPNYKFGLPVTNIGAHWYQNPYPPTDPGYSSAWTGSMERFTFWRSLSGGYWITLNESYAKAWVNQMCNWVATIPVDLTSYVENGRDSAINGGVIQSLQMGMRMEDTWTDAYFHFIQSPSFVDTAVATYAKGVLGHGWRMNWGASIFYDSSKSPSNHEIIEASGLAVAAMVFPEFNDAPTWKQTAFNLLERSMDSTVYDDGAENELSPGYHNWSMNYFTQVAQIAKLNNVSIPDSAYFYDKLKKMYWYNLYLMQPNGYLPPTNDNSDSVAAEAPPTNMWNDPEFQFLASGGTQGKAPDTLSYRFPWAGFNVMRSGWNTQANYIFFKNGPIGSWWHGHEDGLSLFLTCFGYPLLAEAEGWNYDNSLQYYYTKITSAHNTIAVDGKYQHRLDDSTVALKEFPQKVSIAPSRQPWLTNWVADYTSGIYNDGYQSEMYKGSVNSRNFTGSKDYSVSHTRHLVFLKPYYYVVTDFLEGSGSHKYDNYFQLNADSAGIVNSSNKAVASYSSHTTAHLLVSPIDTLGLSDTIVKGRTSASALQGWIAQTEAVPMTQISSLIYTKIQTASTTGASFATLLYPYNNASTPPSVTTSLLTGIGTGIWGCKGTTTYENFIVVIRRYDSLNSTMTITTPFKFTANAHTAIGRQMTNAKDTTITFDSLNVFSGGIDSFTCTKGNYIVNQSTTSQVNVYNDNNASMSITLIRPVSQSFFIPSHQWVKITASGITDSIPNPTDSITNSVNTVMVIGDTMLIGNRYTDLVGHVSNVELFDNTESVEIDSTTPFAVSFKPTTTGLHTLSAVLTDSLGNTVTSQSINVSVNNFEAESFTKDSAGIFGVDLSYSNDTAIVNMKANGWLEYSLDVNHTGKYSLSANVLNTNATNSFSISLDGMPAANSGTSLGNISIPVSSSFQTIKNDSFDVTVGRHTLRVTFNNDITAVDYFRINYYYPVAAFLQAIAFSDTGSLSTGPNHGYLYPIQLNESYGGGVILSNLDSNWIEFKVNVDTTATRSLQLHMADKYSSSGKRTEIYSNGSLIQQNTFPTYTWYGANQTLNDLDTTIVFAKKGPQTLRFKLYGTSTSFGSVSITPTGITNAIKLPASTDTIYAGSSLTIKDSATTNSGTITKVEFYNGDILLATVTTGSGGVFSYNWTNIPYGTFRITTKAYTNSGYFYFSTPLNIFSLYTYYSKIPLVNTPHEKINWKHYNWLACEHPKEYRYNLLVASISKNKEMSAKAESETTFIPKGKHIIIC